MRGVLLLSLLLGTAYAQGPLTKLFKVKKPIMAALMLKLPKNLNDKKEIQKLIDYGKSQHKILKEEKVDAILWEFKAGEILKPKITQKQKEVMATIMKALVKDAAPLIVGFEILWHYPEETLWVAKESGAHYVRQDFFSDDMIAKGTRVPLNPKALLDYRKKIKAENVILLTDIQVKYAEMVDKKITMTSSAKRALKEGSEGLIVSGKASGSSPAKERVRLAKLGAKKADVVIGSGFDYKNAKDLLEYSDAVIVGTSISVKTGGPLVPGKVKQLMKVVNEVRRK